MQRESLQKHLTTFEHASAIDVYTVSATVGNYKQVGLQMWLYFLNFYVCCVLSAANVWCFFSF